MVGFETFLAGRQLLFACLARLRVIHASPLERRLASGKEIFEALEEDLSSGRLESVEAKVNRLGRYRDLMRKLARDEQGNAPNRALAERSELRSEIDPKDLLPFMKLAAQPSRPEMRCLVRPKLSSEATVAEYKPLDLGRDYGRFGLPA